MPEFSPQAKAKLEAVLKRLPSRAAGLLPALWIAQEEWGHLSADVLELVARELHLPPAQVTGTVSFYSLFHRKAVGRHLIHVCANATCSLLGARRLLERLEAVLGIAVGETTPDGRFTLERAECLAACDRGPALQIDFYDHGPVRPEEVERVLAQYP